MDFLKDSFTQGLSNLSSNIGNWFSGLGEDLGKWFSDLTTDIGEFFSNLGTSIGNWFTSLINSLANLLSYLNPFNENFLGKKLVELIGNLLNDLFVPKEDHFGELEENVKSKFGFIEQVKELVFTLFNLNEEEGYEGTPNWSISYSGVEVDIIDWTAFEKYRGFLHGIIIFIMWGSFIIRLYKRIPLIIYGYSDK